MRARLSFNLLLGLVVCAMAAPAHAGLFTTYYRLDRAILDTDGLVELSTGAKAHAAEGWRYEIVGQKDNQYRLYFDKRVRGRQFDPTKDPSEVQSDHIYLVDKKIIDDDPQRKVVVQSLDAGILTVPIKVRPRVTGAERALVSDATFGPAIAYRFGTDLFVTQVQPILSLGLCRVAVGTSGDTVRTETGLTVSTGFQLNVQDRVKLGVIVGWDNTFGDTRRTWPYEGRPWFSLGLNVLFFSPGTGETK